MVFFGGIFWCEEEYRSYRLISQSEENKLARARDTTGDGVSYSGSTTILTPPELKEKRKGTKEMREKNAHTYARVLSLNTVSVLRLRKLASENTRILRQKVSKNLRAGFLPILRQRPNKCRDGS